MTQAQSQFYLHDSKIKFFNEKMRQIICLIFLVNRIFAEKNGYSVHHGFTGIVLQDGFTALKNSPGFLYSIRNKIVRLFCLFYLQ